MAIDKRNFSSSFDYEQAKRSKEYEGMAPIEAKIAGKCLEDQVIPGTNLGIGACELSELCTFANDKYAGVTGICLKAVVGIDPEL